MKRIHLFETQTEHDAAYNSSYYSEPWLAYVKGSSKVSYNMFRNNTNLVYANNIDGNVFTSDGDAVYYAETK